MLHLYSTITCLVRCPGVTINRSRCVTFMLDTGCFQNNQWDDFLISPSTHTSFSKSLLEQMFRRQISLEATKCHAALHCSSAAKPDQDQWTPLTPPPAPPRARKRIFGIVSEFCVMFLIQMLRVASPRTTNVFKTKLIRRLFETQLQKHPVAVTENYAMA